MMCPRSHWRTKNNLVFGLLCMDGVRNGPQLGALGIRRWKMGAFTCQANSAHNVLIDAQLSISVFSSRFSLRGWCLGLWLWDLISQPFASSFRKFLAFVGVVVALGTRRVLVAFGFPLAPLRDFFYFLLRSSKVFVCPGYANGTGWAGSGSFGNIIFLFLPFLHQILISVRAKMRCCCFEYLVFSFGDAGQVVQQERERGNYSGGGRQPQKKYNKQGSACPGALLSSALFSFCRGPGLASRVV